MIDDRQGRRQLRDAATIRKTGDDIDDLVTRLVTSPLEEQTSIQMKTVLPKISAARASSVRLRVDDLLNSGVPGGDPA